MITFYMVRHGKTLFNAMGRIQGSCDSPLIEEGIQEAHRAKEALKNITFSKAFSSTSERAYDTAEIILDEKEIPITRMKALKEFDYGMYDGSLFKEVFDDIEVRKNNGFDFTDIGGDSYETISKRIHEAFSQIVKQCEDGDNVLVVTHGAFGRHTIASLLGVSNEELNKQPISALYPNAGIMVFTYEDQFKLVSMPVKPEAFR